MGDEERKLLQEIAAKPDQDELRLKYADWLDAHREEPKAQYIRMTCEAVHLLQQLKRIPKVGDKCLDIASRADKIRQDNWPHWESSLRSLGVRSIVSYDRGLPVAVVVDGPDFVRNGGAILDAAPTIHTLRLRNTRDNEFAQIVHMSGFAQIKNLNLYWNGLGSPAITALAESPYAANLTRLNLQGNGRTRSLADGIVALANSPNLGRLEEIMLDSVPVERYEAEALANSFTLRSLNRLTIAYNFFPAFVAARSANTTVDRIPLPSLESINGVPLTGRISKHRKNDSPLGR
jgi:uncharacterized protein (TIGR02996 family)